MRTDTATAVRLQDYRPTDWLIDTVDLAVSLDPEATAVKATLSVRPNPAGRTGEPLRLDGDELSLVSVAIDNEILAPDAFAATPDGLVIAQPPQPAFTLDDRDDGRIPPPTPS